MITMRGNYGASISEWQHTEYNIYLVEGILNRNKSPSTFAKLLINKHNMMIMCPVRMSSLSYGGNIGETPVSFLEDIVRQRTIPVTLYKVLKFETDKCQSQRHLVVLYVSLYKYSVRQEDTKEIFTFDLSDVTVIYIYF